VLKPLLLSTYPAGRSAAFADFFEANVLPVLSSRLKATPRSMPALQSLQPRNTSDHSQQACLTAPATLPRQVARYHVLENPTAALSQKYLDGQVIVGSSAKRVFPVPLLQIDSIACRASAFVCQWIPRRPWMRQINQTSKPRFLPNLLPFQVIRIETEQIRDLRLLQRPAKIPFRSEML
jgi:hypothetical protein